MILGLSEDEIREVLINNKNIVLLELYKNFQYYMTATRKKQSIKYKNKIKNKKQE